MKAVAPGMKLHAACSKGELLTELEVFRKSIRSTPSLESVLRIFSQSG